MPGDALTYCVLDIDGGAMLERCVDSIRSQTQPGPVIIVDNGSRTPVSERITGTGIVRFEENRGFAGGANAAMRIVTTPFVAFVNNDVVLDPRWGETVLRSLESPRVAVAQSIVLRADGRVDSAGIEIFRGRFRQVGYGEELSRVVKQSEPWGIAGTAFIIRRDVVEDDLFAERLFAWYEDVDLAARLRSAGWSAALVPEPLAVHLGSASSEVVPYRGEPLRVRNRYLVARSRGTGSVGSLLAEDVRRIGSALAHRRPRTAMLILRGIFSALVSRKLPPLRVRSAPE